MKLNEILKESPEITTAAQLEEWCQNSVELSQGFKIGDLLLKPNGTVDAKMSININSKCIVNGELPIQFGHVLFNFGPAKKERSSFYQLKSLKGFPHTVGGNLIVDGLNVKSFENFPRRIGVGNSGSFESGLEVQGCGITDFSDMNDHIDELRGRLKVSLTRLERGTLSFMKYEHLIFFDATTYLTPPSKELRTLASLLNEYVGQPDKIFDFQTKMIDNNLEQYL